MFFDYEKEEQKQQQAAKGRRFESRFESSGGSSGTIRIIVDRETGVNYLAYSTAEGVGLTVLMDAEGKPVVTKEDT